MRQYQPIWELLKKKRLVSLVAPIDSHQTIVNMVQKEKNKDRAFKSYCSSNYIRYRLYNYSDPKKEVLTFKLVGKILYRKKRR